MIRSFDIFDTCLTRHVLEPPQVFEHLARNHGLGSGFRFARQEAEREAARRHGEATLAEIYEILAGWLGWDMATRDKVMVAELDEETRQLIAIPEMLEKVRECRGRGDTVVFLSDMYLPSAFLVERLREHGFHQEGDHLMVSCEQRKSKTSGQLFEEAIRQLGAGPWEHTGNHLNADVRGAQRAKVKGRYFSRANPTQHELHLQGWSREGAAIGSKWAGASRQARVSLGRLNDREHAISAISTGVAGPLLVAYVTWLMQRAAFLGLTRLYFLARDGQILRDLFIQIANESGVSIDARYLYASRIALRFPRRFPMSDEDAAGVFQANDAIPISVVALRLGIPEDELVRFLPADLAAQGVIPKSRVAQCRDMLASDEASRLLNPVAAERGGLLEAYLRQEGLMDGTAYGLVDLGWGGSLQAGIHKALTDAGHHEAIPGFYLGLRHLPAVDLTIEAFAFDSRKGSTVDVAWFSTLAELFSQADHGSTLGFKPTPEGRIAPILDGLDNDNPLVPDWLDLHQRAVRTFAGLVIEAGAIPDCPSALVRLLRTQLRRFYFLPSKEEAEAWGSCRFSSHGEASIRESLAPIPRSFRDVLWTLGVRRFGAGKAIWPHGAAARSPAPYARFARLLHQIRSRVRPLQW